LSVAIGLGFASGTLPEQLVAESIRDTTNHQDSTAAFPAQNMVFMDLSKGFRRVFGTFRVPSEGYWQPAISAAPDGHSVTVSQTDRDDARVMSIRVN
jgi:hypothetical protein